LVLGVAGIVAAEIWNPWFPINKKLWTSSYVLFTAGFALVCLALCYGLLDVKKWRGTWTLPAVVFGTNAIFAYTFSEVLAKILDAGHAYAPSGHLVNWQRLIYLKFFAPLASPPNASLIYSLVYVLVCLLVTWVLYRKRIFLKI